MQLEGCLVKEFIRLCEYLCDTEALNLGCNDIMKYEQ